MSEVLREARKYEEIVEKTITDRERPLFHLSTRVGWMNDPNGFSYYKGKYHMFYQYHPYDIVWGPMHWGHAVSEDLIHWQYLPAAMGPDEPYDQFGCFSGSAITLDDGRQLLMYTGVSKESQPDGSLKEVQKQCLAVGDGLDYEKYSGNPVITADKLPEGAGSFDFRDPKILRKPDGTFAAIVGNRPIKDKSGQILVFSSKDGFHWEYDHTLDTNRCRYGRMWECPDFFELDGKDVLLVSPQDMLPEGFEYHNGNGTLCLIGHLDENGRLAEEQNQSIDYGIDFYAPQTVLTPDGRRVMIGWMQNWDTSGAMRGEDLKWFGQMSLPRELHVKNGRLYQQPIRELENLRRDRIEYKDVKVEGPDEDLSSSLALNLAEKDSESEITLDGVKGRCVDITMKIRPEEAGRLFDRFTIKFASSGEHYSMLIWRPKERILRIDRKFSGSRRAIIHQRRALVPGEDEAISIRLIVDRFSAEAFIDDGIQVMTITLYTEQEAGGISFSCRGKAMLDVEKYSLE